MGGRGGDEGFGLREEGLEGGLEALLEGDLRFLSNSEGEEEEGGEGEEAHNGQIGEQDLMTVGCFEERWYGAAARLMSFVVLGRRHWWHLKKKGGRSMGKLSRACCVSMAPRR